MSQSDQTQTDIPETLLSLLVAFSIALAFRGFVVEGFVIPTGSMAPTLMGQHYRYQSPRTGYEYAFDPSTVPPVPGFPVAEFDPMLAQDRSTGRSPAESILSGTSAGDRVLVLKYLYEFFEPDRWDVVVFKNPVNPVGPSQNYIKRLAGLPNEQVLIADGDVFTAPHGAGLGEFRIARRPSYVQDAIWQPVYDSDFISVDSVEEPPFAPSGPSWTLKGTRTWRCETTAETSLDWSDDRLPVDDFNAYNIYRYVFPDNRRMNPIDNNGAALAPWYKAILNGQRIGDDQLDPVADIRLSAAIAPEDPEAFRTTFVLEARNHEFEFELAAGVASITMRDADGSVVEAAEGVYGTGPGGLIDVVFTHVDQALSISVGGDEVVRLAYEWNPLQRLEAAHAGFELEAYRRNPDAIPTRRPRLSWRFSGSPMELARVRLDRDLHYKGGRLAPAQQANRPAVNGMLFATDPLEPAVLGPDQFLMLGDNSGASLDSRWWGPPHPLSVLTTGDEAPFIVPRDMLVGKAWCVYFPAPTAIAGSGPRLMPDFGRLRFIR